MTCDSSHRSRIQLRMSRPLAVCLFVMRLTGKPTEPGKLRAQDISSRPRLASAGQFVVGELRIEGLQRISEGTVFNYLPINIGDCHR